MRYYYRHTQNLKISKTDDNMNEIVEVVDFHMYKAGRNVRKLYNHFWNDLVVFYKSRCLLSFLGTVSIDQENECIFIQL